ncbi:MAG: tetratricopeptide repeat protein [Polyangiales bacterium]
MARSLATALALALAAAPAAAQPQPPPSPPPSDALDPVALEAARRLFFEAYAAGERGDWETAYRGFSRALAIRTSPALRFNLAIAARNTGRFVEAVDQLRALVREGGDEARVEAARREIELLSARVAQLRVSVTGDTPRSFELDGRAQPVALLGVDVPVDPGPHTIEVVGEAGDRQRREGALYEGERMQVAVSLSRDAIAAGASAPRSQGFGHWVTQPGPDGRWVDWAAQALPEPPRSRWSQRPFTVALQLGLNAPSGLAAVSLRYFPRPGFGAEVSLGGLGAFQPGFAILAHARVASPTSRHAFGFFAGPGLALASLTLTCPVTPTGCQREERTERSLPAVSFIAGLSSEWRVIERISLRATAGLRALLNPADFRALEDPAYFSTCGSNDAIGWGTTACDANQRPSPHVAPFVAVDVGYSF